MKLTLEPDTVPDTVPVPFVPVLLSVIVNAPEKEVPDCVSAHVISPGPDESVAVPDHEPLTLAGLDDGVEGEGVVGDAPPPLHPAARRPTPRTAPARTREKGVKIMVETRRILARRSFDTLAEAALMKPCDCIERHAPRRVVLTGGPGAGKSAVLELISPDGSRA